MKLGLGLGVNSITSQKVGGFTGLLDTYTGAVSGYSVRKLLSSATKSINVRRSSDGDVRDIGFDGNGNLDTTALQNFVNEDVDTYTSDFTSTEDFIETNGTGSAGQSIGGEDNAYKFILTGGSGTHQAVRSSGLVGEGTAELKFKYFIPSSQTVDGLLVGIIGGSTQSETTTGAWTSVTLPITNFGNGNILFRAKDGGSTTVDGNDDVFYLKDIVVTQTSGDGFVTTLYDQTGNNDLSNSNASQQPKIVGAGSVITKGGETALKFNDVEFLQKTSATTNWVADSNLSIFSVFSVTDYTAAVDADRQVLYNISGDLVASSKGDTIVAMVRSDQMRIGFRDEAGGSFTKKKGFKSAEIGAFDDTQVLTSSIYDASSTLTSILNDSTNGTETGAPDGNRVNNTFTIGALHNGAKTLTGFIQELVIWNSDQTSNRGNIAGDINTYFDIYS